MGGEKGILKSKNKGWGSKVADVPKGCLAIKVGGDGEERQRFIVPVIYINHPLFLKLLKEAEDEYGFDQKGTITIPCRLDYFRWVHSAIDKEMTSSHHHHHQQHHHNYLHNHRAIAGCFGA